MTQTRDLVPVHIVSLGCARNEVDSEELAARFLAGGFTLTDSRDDARVIVVNTCGFIEAAKMESLEEIFSTSTQATGHKPTVVVAGCMAERYGQELASSLPEGDAIIGFDGYDDIASTVRNLVTGGRIQAHTPTDRRQLLPIAPIQRVDHHGPPWVPSQRVRLNNSPSAPLKIASGCDRRCAFCSIPSFRGSFQSRRPEDILHEAQWLAGQSVKELFLVSENTTSYGKDIGSGALESLIAQLSLVEAIEWIRLSYLQPAEVRPSLIEAIASTPKVVPYFDLPFQHASGSVLRRMRRFGDAETFLGLIDQVRQIMPDAGIRTNVIVGFPGETETDYEILTQFIGEAGLDAVGVFGYSDEEGTEAAGLDGHVDEDEIHAREVALREFADTVTAMRAEDRVGNEVKVLIEEVASGESQGRSQQQGPEDGQCYIAGAEYPRGEILSGRIVDTDGVDWQIEVYDCL
ncbi:MAG: 30S ribosomal protein S12 methylthiotransferase RimO [Propionibacteriaceae bacterium]|nr:30S ribosomal protein S12 methylthiotransferase RimO [Propionibacteriaceae bacterium]